MKKSILLGLLLMGFLLNANAQKYGYVTSGALLEKMPEMEQMRSNLEAYQSQLQKKGEQMFKDFQAKQTDAASKKERGELAPVQEQKILEELQKQQEELVNFEQEMQDMLLSRQDELLKPILERVNDAIKDVSKEEGFTMVFDMSSGAILFTDENLDITAKVKEKLGIVE
jgi:outer membrane protein